MALGKGGLLRWLAVWSCVSLARGGWCRCTAGVGFRFGCQQSRAAAHDSAVWPVLFAKKDFALAGITVIPAGQQPQMLAEHAFVSACCRGLGPGVFQRLGRCGLPTTSDNVVGGARFGT